MTATNQNLVKNDVSPRAIYTSPHLTDFGSVAELTLGNNGTSVDGNNSRTQAGGGNNNN